MQRILCVNPEHKERTPSMVLYETYAHCFACGYRVPISQLGREHQPTAPRLPPTDLAAELARIKSLPRASVRALELPVDGDSYYILWPSGDYYKRRKFIAGDGPKYTCPRGHAKPLFISSETKSNTLAFVEGELNALSLSSINPPFSVCSPGSATDFNEKILERNANFICKYTRFLLLLDRDPAGFQSAKKFKGLLLQRTPYVSVALMRRDCNELLLDGTLKEECKKWCS